MKQPKESDGTVVLYVDDDKNGNSKKQIWKKFKAICNYSRIQGHKLADCNRCKAIIKNHGEGAK